MNTQLMAMQVMNEKYSHSYVHHKPNPVKERVLYSTAKSHVYVTPQGRIKTKSRWSKSN